jgi:hypothetical protein
MFVFIASEVCASGIGCCEGLGRTLDGSGIETSGWESKVGGAGIRRQVLQDKQV